MMAKETLAVAALCALLAVPQAVEARTLAGQLAMGDGCTLVMDLKEGLFSEMFRTVRLKSSPRERVDIHKLGQEGDRVFVGTDYYLYVQKKGDGGYSNDQTFKIGRAHKLWEIKAADGVAFAEVESVMNTFTGNGGNKTLKVTFDKADKKADDVERAGMKFWLDELVYQYDSPGTRKGKLDNYQVISSSLIAALPSRSDDPQEKFNNFKVLATHLKESKDSDLVPFRDLLAKKLESLEAEKGKAKDDADKFQDMQKEYERLKTDVLKRTEGL